jgi:hypothetical protein
MSDTISLLRECDAGIKMAVESIDEVAAKVKDVGLLKILQKSKEEHQKLGNEVEDQIKMYGAQEKEPNIMARGMSWMKTNVKMGMDDNTSKVAADLITDGCDMGTKSLYQYLNQYDKADEKAKSLCKKLIAEEENLCKQLRKYL